MSRKWTCFLGYTGTFWGHKTRVLQAAAGFDQGEVTQGSLGLCRVWLCCIVLGSPPAYPKVHSALAPAVQKSAQSVPSDASEVQVQHTNHLFFANHLFFPTGHSSGHVPAMAWAGVLAAVRMVRSWGWLLLGVMEPLGNAGRRGKVQSGMASIGCSYCLYTSAHELDRARDLRRNSSAT